MAAKGRRVTGLAREVDQTLHDRGIAHEHDATMTMEGEIGGVKVRGQGTLAEGMRTQVSADGETWTDTERAVMLDHGRPLDGLEEIEKFLRVHNRTLAKHLAGEKGQKDLPHPVEEGLGGIATVLSLIKVKARDYPRALYHQQLQLL